MSAPTSPSPKNEVSASLSNGLTGQDKNAEIWSTRLQRELLALTTDNVTAETKTEMTVVLPEFCSVKEHALDIERGNCTLTCLLNLPKTETPSEATTTDPITVTFDVSLKKNADGSVETSAVAFPFLKPMAILASGSGNFPAGSSIKDGECIDVELDWTPSLHLSDAVLNVALKIKESLSQGEPMHGTEYGSLQKSELVNKAKKLGSSFGATIRKSLAVKGDKKKTRRLLGRKKNAARPKATASEVRIGDEINMLEAPWVDCQGVYSCKAIRRPKFAEEAIKTAEAKDNKTQGVRDFSEAAAQPVAQKVNERTAVFNKQVGKLVSKFNKAIENMKTGVHDLARGMTDGLKDASEKVAAQLAQSVHEHIRQEIELARAAEPAS